MDQNAKLKENINMLRSILYKKIESNKLCSEEIVELSQKLDSLILEYYRNEKYGREKK